MIVAPDTTDKSPQGTDKSLEEGEITEGPPTVTQHHTPVPSKIPGTEPSEMPEVTVPTPPAKRRKCGRESLLEQAMEKIIPNSIIIRSSNIIWVDLEMTGLDIEKDFIMEMACIVTDKNLNLVAEGPSLVIHQSEEVLASMGDWCTIQHHKTGLTQQCRDSNLSCADVEQQMIEFISKYCPKGRCELAGNSIHCDRRFIMKYMPDFLSWLHYRIIDVSSIRNVAGRWYPNFERFQSSNPCTHRALDDIRCSIEELQFYKETVFKSSEQYRVDIEGASDQDGFDNVMSRYEAIQFQKKINTDQEISADNDISVDEKVEAQGPVNVSVNGKNITLFGN